MGGDSMCLACPTPAHGPRGLMPMTLSTPRAAPAHPIQQRPTTRQHAAAHPAPTTMRPKRAAPWLTIVLDGPPRMVKRPTGSGGEPSSPNCGASAGGKARQLPLFCAVAQKLPPRVSPFPSKAGYACGLCGLLAPCGRSRAPLVKTGPMPSHPASAAPPAPPCGRWPCWR